MDLQDLYEWRRRFERELDVSNESGERANDDFTRGRVLELLEALETTIIERDAAQAASREVVHTIRTTPPPSAIEASATAL